MTCLRLGESLFANLRLGLDLNFAENLPVWIRARSLTISLPLVVLESPCEVASSLDEGAFAIGPSYRYGNDIAGKLHSHEKHHRKTVRGRYRRWIRDLNVQRCQSRGKSFCAAHMGGAHSRKKQLDNFDRTICGEAYPTAYQSSPMDTNGQRKSFIKDAPARSRKAILRVASRSNRPRSGSRRILTCSRTTFTPVGSRHSVLAPTKRAFVSPVVSFLCHSTEISSTVGIDVETSRVSSEVGGIISKRALCVDQFSIGGGSIVTSSVVRGDFLHSSSSDSPFNIYSRAVQISIGGPSITGGARLQRARE
jgi:hypothetical protein